MGSLTGIRQSSSQGRVATGIYEDSSQAEFARWCLRRGGNPAAGSHAGIRESTRGAGSVGHKKSAAPKNGALPRITTGANQIRPES